MSRHRLSAVGTVLLGAALLLTWPSAASAQWTIEDLVAPKYFTSYFPRAIALDTNGRPHVAYGGDHLYHAYYDGSAWQYEVVDSRPGVGLYASIAVDSSDKVHIAYRAGYYLGYASNASGTWATRVVDGTVAVGWPISIAVGGSGDAHISYWDSSHNDLRYATNASGDWVVETVDDDEAVGAAPSIALDSSGHAHISYLDFMTRDLKYATNASGSWALEVVDVGDVGWTTSIAIGPGDSVHILFLDADSLHYATNATGAWVKEAVGTSTGADFASMALGPGGFAHISYSTSFGGLRYATNATGAWTSEVVKSVTGPGDYGVGAYNSIAVDGSGKAHLSFFRNSTQGLCYATNVSGSWADEELDWSGNPGQYHSLSVDGAGKLHISYSDTQWNYGSLNYLTNASGSWVSEATGDTGRPYDNAIRLDSAGHVHIAVRDNYWGNVKHATNASGTWVTEPVGSPEGLYLNMDLDSSDHVHMTYLDSTSGVVHATNTSGSWEVEVVDGASGLQGVAAAMDAVDHLHIVYYDAVNQILEYATNASGAWVIEPVQNGMTYGLDIAIDSTNHPHISYFENGNGYNKHATNASGSWVIEDVVQGQSTTTSIAVDSADHVHIAWGAIQYATNASGVWVNQRVLTGDLWGSFSLAVDAQNNAYISFYDGSTYDFKLATKFAVTADLVLTQTDAPDPVLPGGSLTYTLTVDNNGPETATGVVLQDTLPPGATLVSASADPHGTCGEDAGVVTCDIGAMVSGATVTVTVGVTAPSTPGTISNSVTVGCTTHDPNPADNTATEQTTVMASTYTLTVVVDGSGRIEGDGISCPGDCSETYDQGTSVSLTAVPDAEWQFVQWSGDLSGTTNPASVLMSADRSVTAHFARLASDLALTLADSPDPVFTGQTLTYTVTVTNNGPGSATDVGLADTLPGGATFVSAVTTQGSCSHASGTVACAIGPMASGASVVATIIVTAPAVAGTITDNATVTCTTADPDLTNNTASAGTTVQEFGQVTVLSPNGGEVLPSGGTHVIRWGAPPAAVRFAIYYSRTSGSLWSLITGAATGTSYTWTLPAPPANQKKCLVRVIAFDASGTKVGTDVSDAPFTIEVVRLVTPNGGESLRAYDRHTITWHTNATAYRVGLTILSYSVNGGRTWKRIARVSGNPGQYSWRVPRLWFASSKCQVRVALQSGALGSDASDGTFAITW